MICLRAVERIEFIKKKICIRLHTPEIFKKLNLLIYNVDNLIREKGPALGPFFWIPIEQSRPILE